MKQKSELSPMQNFAWTIMCVVAMVGIYKFLGTQTDVKDPFVIGVYFIVCGVVVWGSRRFVAANVDESGCYIRKGKR